MSHTLATNADAGFLQRLFFRDHAGYELGRQADDLFMFIWWYSVFWFVLLMGLMIYWTIKYRRRPGVPTPRSPHHSTPLEIAWTVIPSLVLIYLFFAGLGPYLGKLIVPAGAEVLDVVGYKWSWRVTYDNGGNPPELVELGGDSNNPVIVVPAGRPIVFKLKSDDVIHSFWIPDFRIKVDALPNRITSYWIEAQEPGEHWIFCAEYCGDSHSEMAALLRVVTYAEYLEYKANLGIDPNAPPWEKGQLLAKAKGGCFACHSIDGGANVGPTWKDTGAGQFGYGHPIQFTDGTSLTAEQIATDPVAWENYARESIIDPNAKKRVGYAAGGMSSFRGVLNDEEIGYIIAYMRHLNGFGPAEGDPAAGAAPADGAEAPAPADADGPADGSANGQEGS